MYTLALRREFIARHFLIGGDWGPENFPNSHHYALELQLKGPALDEHGYLCDLVEVEETINEKIGYFSEKMLNDLPEFLGLNPSLEHFARILCSSFSEKIKSTSITGLSVILWENASAWASYEINRP
jgi:6-pyruvoyltetrahydropterin/6-carboxytetrahydropterin synthase